MSWQRGYGETTYDPEPRPRPDWVMDAPVRITKAEADRKAQRAFTYAAVIFGILGFGAGYAFAGDTANYGGTGCTLVPVEGEAHIAEARCTNIQIGGYQSVVGADLTAGTLTVHLLLDQGPGKVPDSFTITPPDGYFADPETLILDEFTEGTIRIYPFVGA
jgi:hypothetical protein